jgi:predicted transcriptional regulator
VAKKRNSEPDPAYIKAIKAAQEEVDAGKTVSSSRVRRWLLSWGTKHELPRPNHNNARD